MKPAISLVIPVYNAAEHLRTCLEHLARSTVPGLECIVVDDGSSDESARIAREFGARVVDAGKQGGPARARNLGAKEARGELLLFIDADVCVYPDTLEKIVTAFEEDPEMAALIGSYDDSPPSKGFISQYKNLMHCFVHQHGRRHASSFWSGCGAIRRSVFFEHGGFDESYGRPAVEDIEFGYRLVRAGRKVILDRTLQVKHLKRWTLAGLLKTDILDRAIPWTGLILRDRCMPNDLNLDLRQRASVALAFLMAIIGVAAALSFPSHVLTGALFFLAGTTIVLNRGFYAFLAARRGWPFAAASIPLHLLYHLYSGISFLAGLVCYGWSVARKGKQALRSAPAQEDAEGRELQPAGISAAPDEGRQG